MIEHLEALSGGGDERSGELIYASVEFDLLYPGVNERFNELLSESASKGRSASFIGKWGTLPWAIAFSPSREELVAMKDVVVVNESNQLPTARKRSLEIFPATREGDIYRITSPRAEESSNLFWATSANGDCPWGPSGSAHRYPLNRIWLLWVMNSDDLVPVPFRKVCLTLDSH
jgi:hypothetical protein